MLNKLPIVLLLLCLLPKLSVGQVDQATPSTMLDVYVDSVHYRIKDGDTLNLPLGQIVVKSSNLLAFDHGVLNFYYPKHFSQIYEEDFAYKNWTLDGNDFVIMYFETHENTELYMLVEEMKNQFGKKNCKIVDHTAHIGKLELKGKKITATLFGIVLAIDIYELESSDQKSHFLAFQDLLKENGLPSSESLETMAIINSTISYK